jgi:hypothetical protein
MTNCNFAKAGPKELQFSNSNFVPSSFAFLLGGEGRDGVRDREPQR